MTIAPRVTIDHFSFGRIVVAGQTYTKDVMVHADGVDSPWWRQEGHRLAIVDLETAIRRRPELLIIGTGTRGMMAVPAAVLAHLEAIGIRVEVLRTDRAVERFNGLPEQKKAVAALHLTC